MDDTYSKDNFLPVSNVTSDGDVDHQKQLGEKKETEDITIFLIRIPISVNL